MFFYILIFSQMKKSIIIATLCFMITGSIIYAQGISFPDVQQGDWYYEDVMNMVEWDVIRGNDDGTFKPANNVNRAELSAMWNRYDNRVMQQLDKLEDRVFLAEFENARSWTMISYSQFLDLLEDEPHIYCDPVLHYYPIFDTYSEFRTQYEQIDTGLNGLEITFEMVEKNCDDLGYPLY
jgi:hypothetical protein